MFIFRTRARSKSAAERPPDDVEVLRRQCTDLERRLAESEERLRERTELLYELQKHYSSEHFDFQESLRELKIERMRNAGVTADRDIVRSRTAMLQERIADLKQRLRRHELCDDHWLDDAPMSDESLR